MRVLAALRAVVAYHWPLFRGGPAARLGVRIQRGCSFGHRRRITVGRGVRFLRGAIVHADPEGKIVLQEGAVICRYAILQSVGGTIEVGARSSVGDFCNLYGQGGLWIGSDVMLASGVRIVPARHTFEDPSLPVRTQPTTASGVTIADGAWLGVNVVVLDGVTVGRNAVIGAGSVVTRSIPDGALAVGVPARVISQR